MPYFCYLLECSDGSYYTGWSVNPHKRSLVHNTGNGSRYTRMHRPVKLVYVEELPNLSSALKREKAIKRLKHKQKKQLAQSSQIPLEENP
jgi:putative endonuclease